MLKDKLKQDIKETIAKTGFNVPDDIVLSIPKIEQFGDYSTNIALQLSKQDGKKIKQSPIEIANKIAVYLQNLDYIKQVSVAGPGFINIFVKPEFIAEQVAEILKQGESYGKSNLGNGAKVQVEFISANPTGPLTLANGRGGAIGDSLSNILEWSGYQVDREYYVNDTGNQIKVLGLSAQAAAGKIEYKDEFYKGEYVKDLAKKFTDKLELDPLELGHMLADYLLENEIKQAIERMGIHFDEFYSERSLYERNLIVKVLEILKEKDLTYEKDGALWFKSTQFGDEKDRVLMTSKEETGRRQPTYFLADIAHHIDVFSRGYEKRINILGADHHSYGQRMKGVMEGLGYKGKLDIIFMQLVKLFKEGKEVRMSKRAGTFVTLDELLDQVNKDAARFFFLMYSPDSHIDFNLDLAQEQSNKNPVFYVQYAHARTINILSKAESDNYLVTSELLNQPAEINLMKHLELFPELVLEIAQSYEVHRLTGYCLELADFFHRFYESCRVIGVQPKELESSRLALVKASQITLANALRLLGVTAPEKM